MWFPYNFDIKEMPTCRKWNLLSLLRASNSYESSETDWSFKGLTLTYNSDGSVNQSAGLTETTLLTSGEFFKLIRSKFYTYNFCTPIYYDYYQEKYVDSTDNIDPGSTDDNVHNAYTQFKQIWDEYCADCKRLYGTLYDSIMQKYNPISNYDKHSHITLDYKGKETSETEYAGEETDTLTKSGKELNKETPYGYETDTLTKSGTETNTLEKTGKEKTTNSNAQQTNTNKVSAFDSGSSEFLNKEQNILGSHDDTSETEYGSSSTHRKDETTTSFGIGNNARKDENKHEFSQDRKTENELSFNNRQDENVKSFTDRTDTTEKSFTNRQDETNEYTYGNIGVTTTQQMAMSSFQMAEIAHIKEYIVSEFAKRYLVID